MSSSSAVRSWRTAFLTLRDENLASRPRATVVRLLDQLILSQSDSLITAAPQLPPHELTSDFILLLELARNLAPSQQGIEDATQTFIKLSQLIHGISRSSFLEMNSTLWTLVLDSFKRIVQIFLGKAKTEGAFIGDVAVIKPTKQCLESLRLLFSLYQAAASLSENGQLLNFVFEVVDYFQRDSKHSTYFSDNCSVSGDCSDNDGSVMDNSKGHFAKARLAAIVCVQDLCRADPKLFTAQWTMLLPSNDVLQHRKYDTTLMSCLLSDPSLKVRIGWACFYFSSGSRI